MGSDWVISWVVVFLFLGIFIFGRRVVERGVCFFFYSVGFKIRWRLEIKYELLIFLIICFEFLIFFEMLMRFNDVDEGN